MNLWGVHFHYLYLENIFPSFREQVDQIIMVSMNLLSFDVPKTGVKKYFLYNHLATFQRIPLLYSSIGVISN